MRKFRLMIVAVMVAATLTAAPAEAQVDEVTLEYGVHRDPLYRRVADPMSYFSGVPINADTYVVPSRYSRPRACLRTTVFLAGPGTSISNDSQCRLGFVWLNNSTKIISMIDVAVEGDQAILVRDISVSSNEFEFIQPGETGIVSVFVGFGPEPGEFDSRLRLTANTGQGAFFDLPYEIVETSPSFPREVATTVTSDSLTVTWVRPEFDGGTDITGYVVELVAPKTFDPADRSTNRITRNEWWWARMEVCDFRGRPLLNRCDIPNNLAKEVAAGNYLVAVQALSVADPEPSTHVDVFYTPELTLQPLPERQAEPQPPLATVTAQACPCPVARFPHSFLEATTIDELVGAVDYSEPTLGPVLRLYQAYCNCQPDVSGAIRWSMIRHNFFNNGEPGSLSNIAGWMADDNEFEDKYSRTSNGAFVERMYETMLGRSAEPAGYAYWVGVLHRGELDRAGVVFYVTANGEFINRYPYGRNGLL